VFATIACSTDRDGPPGWAVHAVQTTSGNACCCTFSRVAPSGTGGVERNHFVGSQCGPREKEHLSQVLCLAEAARRNRRAGRSRRAQSAAEHYAATRAPPSKRPGLFHRPPKVVRAARAGDDPRFALPGESVDRVVRERPPAAVFRFWGNDAVAGQGSATGPYCAPELLVPGRQPDPAMRLYSLGCVFYELLIDSRGRPRRQERRLGLPRLSNRSESKRRCRCRGRSCGAPDRS